MKKEQPSTLIGSCRVSNNNTIYLDPTITEACINADCDLWDKINTEIKNYIGTYFNQFNYDNIKQWTIKKPL